MTIAMSNASLAARLLAAPRPETRTECHDVAKKTDDT
jgi:hypothetical protein